MDLKNLTPQETAFKNALSTAGIPTTDQAFRAEWQGMADDAGIPIANASPFSAFWVLLTNVATQPVLWLIAFLIRHVMPNLYVKTATGLYLDCLGWAYDVERKPAVAMQCRLTFRRTNAAQPLVIPAGAQVRTVPIKGRIFRVATLAEAIMPAGKTTIDVLAEAVEPGSAYNLAEGYYAILESDVRGIDGISTAVDYLETPGTDAEPDEQYRLRIRDQFAAVGDWHTDAKYRSLIANFVGFRPDRIFFKGYDGVRYPCRGPGSADAFILFDTDPAPKALLEEVNNYIEAQGNHGHGDSLTVMAIPTTRHAVGLTVIFRQNTSFRAALLADIEQMIRCAFRENQEYADQVTQTWPFARFSFSNLGREIHDYFDGVESLKWDQADIVADLNVPRLGALTIREG